MNASAYLPVHVISSARRAPLGGHLWHTVAALGFLVVSLGGIWVAERVQHRGARTPAEPTSTPRRAPATQHRVFLLPLVALSGAAAAGVHYTVMPQHFAQSTLYGLFFAGTATCQLGYSALLLARPSRPLLVAGAAGHLLVVLLWLLTRLVSIPVGPAAGSTESFGALDILASGFELAFVTGAVLLLVRGTRLRPVLRPTSWSPALPVLAVSAAASIAVVAYLYPPT